MITIIIFASKQIKHEQNTTKEIFNSSLSDQLNTVKEQDHTPHDRYSQ